MESITKNRQPDGALRAMAARAYGPGQVPAGEDWVSELGHVEWDLWDGNVMVRDGAIVAIIDHERAFYGDPLIEGGFTGAELPAFGDPAAFLRGYGYGALTEAERVRRRLYGLYLTLITVIETVYRGHTDTGQYDFGREQLTQAMELLGR